jgi:hypothetical protein
MSAPEWIRAYFGISARDLVISKIWDLPEAQDAFNS